MIPHNKPTFDDSEAQAAARVLASGWVAQGPEVAAFENEMCAFLGLPEGHAVALSSGSAALFMALWALGAGDKHVAYPVYACAALRNAVAWAGGVECLRDIDTRGPNVALGTLAAGADIAIVPHMFGIPADLSGADGVDIIEDCAQAIGGSMYGIPLGLQGKIGIYSFYATKLMTAGGQGGMLVSRDKSLVDSVRDFREFDCRHDRTVRFNFQMTDVQAAIGRVQLAKLPRFLERRAAIYARYREAGFDLLDAEAGASPVRYRAVLRSARAQQIIAALAEKGVRAIVPVEDWELLGDAEHFPNAAALSRETVSLPIYPNLTDEDVGKIIDGVRFA